MSPAGHLPIRMHAARLCSSARKAKMSKIIALVMGSPVIFDAAGYIRVHTIISYFLSLEFSRLRKCGSAYLVTCYKEVKGGLLILEVNKYIYNRTWPRFDYPP